MFEETDLDRLYQPQPGCCEDCQDEAAAQDFEAWQQELTP